MRAATTILHGNIAAADTNDDSDDDDDDDNNDENDDLSVTGKKDDGWRWLSSKA